MVEINDVKLVYIVERHGG